jgi:predicted nucleic acid-binding Zn ribbon protein
MAWTSLGSFCKDLVLRIAGDKYRLLALIALNWQDVVGELLAERSTPVKYEHHVLFVRVSNPTWMQELVLIKDKVMERLNRTLELQCNDIVFTAGKKHAKR